MDLQRAATGLQKAKIVRMEIAGLYGFHLGAASHAPGDEAEDHRNFARALQDILEFVDFAEEALTAVSVE